MVDGFPYEVAEEYQNMPLLKGRATVDMKVKVKDNPNLEKCVVRIVLDGYNASVTAGNFIDLVERHFYDGREIQRADGFVVQTGDPEGPTKGFIDPCTEKTRTVPLEIMVIGEKAPFYGETLENKTIAEGVTKNGNVLPEIKTIPAENENFSALEAIEKLQKMLILLQ